MKVFLDLKIETIEYLKKEFEARWPDAADLVKSSESALGHRVAASCLWLGFKEGYALAMARPD